jgi:ATP-dependent Zn protease
LEKGDIEAYIQKHDEGLGEVVGERAVDILQKHRDGLDRVAKDLLQKEEITGKEVLELLGAEKIQASVDKSASKSAA